MDREKALRTVLDQNIFETPDALRLVLDREAQELQERAEALVAAFFARSDEQKAAAKGTGRKLTKSEYPTLTIRLQANRDGPGIFWRRIKFAKSATPSGAIDYSPLNQHIKLGKTGIKYELRQIAGFARDWELDLFNEFEPKFMQLRRRARTMQRIRMALHALEQAEVGLKKVVDVSAYNDGDEPPL